MKVIQILQTKRVCAIHLTTGVESLGNGAYSFLVR